MGEGGQRMPASTTDLVRAWTDPEFRATLVAFEREIALEHPSGSVDAELDQLHAAFDPVNRLGCPITTFSTQPCCY
jgi:mersacidin/lichenicidin family type 2 lantibiotic